MSTNEGKLPSAATYTAQQLRALADSIEERQLERGIAMKLIFNERAAKKAYLDTQEDLLRAMDVPESKIKAARKKAEAQDSPKPLERLLDEAINAADTAEEQQE